MPGWLKIFHHDPVAPFLASGNEIIAYFVKRDILEEKAKPVQTVWNHPDVLKILKKQMPDGSWPYPGGKNKNIYPANHYSLFETWKIFRYLIEQYEMTKIHPVVDKAAEFLLSFQTEEGDIRGMLANQYAMYYTGAILSLLINAGYEDDPRIEKGLQWLLSMRQYDGGWISSPILQLKAMSPEVIRLTTQYAEPMRLDRNLPSSHNWTGMVIRPFAVSRKYRSSEAVKTAANLLKKKFFQDDIYTSYQDSAYWVKFQYPYWWNNLISAMDSLSSIGIPKEDTDIKKALEWFLENQEENGLWKLSYGQKKKKDTESIKEREMKLWISLAVCRIFKRYYEL